MGTVELVRVIFQGGCRQWLLLSFYSSQSTLLGSAKLLPLVGIDMTN